MPKSGTESEIAMLIMPMLFSPSNAAATARPKIASLERNTPRISTPRRLLSLQNFGTSQEASAYVTMMPIAIYSKNGVSNIASMSATAIAR